MTSISKLKQLLTYEGQLELVDERIDALLKELTLEGFTDEQMAMGLDEAARWAWARHHKKV